MQSSFRALTASDSREQSYVKEQLCSKSGGQISTYVRQQICRSEMLILYIIFLRICKNFIILWMLLLFIISLWDWINNIQVGQCCRIKHVGEQSLLDWHYVEREGACW